MAIKPQRSNQGADVWKYTPGMKSFPGVGSCGVVPGDVFMVKDVAWAAFGVTSDIIPDENGYMPHLAYYPGSDFLSDPRSTYKHGDEGVKGQLKRHPGHAYSNDSSPPVVRVDLRGPLYARWKGDITMEGGFSVGGAANQLLVSYLWSRTWVEEEDGLVQRVDHPHLAHTLSLYNQGGVDRGTGIPNRIKVPFGATRVWTPNPVTINADNGQGTTAAALISDFTRPVPVSSYQFVWTADPQGVIVFEVYV